MQKLLRTLMQQLLSPRKKPKKPKKKIGKNRKKFYGILRFFLGKFYDFIKLLSSPYRQTVDKF
jgi:hypothetical protein